MSAGELGTSAPDFALIDTRDAEVRLSDYAGKRRVHLVFNRGFF